MSLSFLATTAPTDPNFFLPKSFKSPFSSVSHSITKRFFYVSCNKNDQNVNLAGDIDRRNVLLGLGGVYGASTVFGSKMAIAETGGDPIQPPDLLKGCQPAKDGSLKHDVNCCPSEKFYKPGLINDIRPFHFPTTGLNRVRKPVSELTWRELNQFREAIRLMKAYREEHPWNFMQQANVHCAYCNYAYKQDGSGAAMQIHGSWLFPAWHRYYTYFWERILGKLVGDENFALPYWNWDNRDDGMMGIPKAYNDKGDGTKNSLYNCKRNVKHYDALFDYDYQLEDPNPIKDDYERIIEQNLRRIEKFYEDSSLKNPQGFMGGTLYAGQPWVYDGGVLEALHNTVHDWSGEVEDPNWDMGNLHTAARDPLFFAHHGNIDRLWSIYRKKREDIGLFDEFEDDGWLDASFIFYDDNNHLVKCKVRDCLKDSRLGYTYQDINSAKFPWDGITKSYFQKKKATSRSLRAGPEERIGVAEFGDNSRVLDTTIRALVKRPKASRSKEEKEADLEVIVISDITFDHSTRAFFNVYIANPMEGSVGVDLGELAGTFRTLPHSHDGGEGPKSVLRVGISQLLEEMEVEESEELVVSLVPKQGEVTVGGITIEHVPAQRPAV